jgi:hypothetical protein
MCSASERLEACRCSLLERKPLVSSLSLYLFKGPHVVEAVFCLVNADIIPSDGHAHLTTCETEVRWTIMGGSSHACQQLSLKHRDYR